MKQEMSLYKYILEIRYKPDPRLTDKLGALAQELLVEPMTNWRRDGAKVEFSAKDNPKISSLFSFKGLGVFFLGQDNQDAFKAYSKAFLKKSWNHIIPSDINRLGVRVMKYKEATGFSTLLDQYKNSFLSLTDQEIGSLGGEIIDVGFSLNLESTQGYKFNVNTGPMKKDQAVGLMESGELEIPVEGVFLDVDFFKDGDNLSLKQKDYIDFIDESETRFNEIENSVLKILNNGTAA